jgi:hypothetical protein
MGKFGRELGESGVMRGAAGPLRPESEAARARTANGQRVASDGPAVEPPEMVLCGYFAVDVPDRAAAIELAKRCPYARVGVVEVRATRYTRVSEADGRPQFLLLYLHEPSGRPSEERIREGMVEMRAFADAVTREGKYLAGAVLPPAVPAARVEIRGAREIVTDGPFAESKEVFGGFALIQAASRAEAIEIAKRCPSSSWGVTEVREVGLIPK